MLLRRNVTFQDLVESTRLNVERIDARIAKQKKRFEGILDGTFGAARRGLKDSEAKLAEYEKALADAQTQLEAKPTEENIQRVSIAKNSRDVFKELLGRQKAKLSLVKIEDQKEKARQALAAFEVEFPELVKNLQKKAAKYAEAIEAARATGQVLQRDFDVFCAEAGAAGVDAPGSAFLQLESPLRWLGILIAKDWSSPTMQMYEQERAYVMNAPFELERMIKNRLKKAWADLEKPAAKRSPVQVTLDGLSTNMLWEPSEGNEGIGPDSEKQKLAPIHPQLGNVIADNPLLKGQW